MESTRISEFQYLRVLPLRFGAQQMHIHQVNAIV